MWYGVCRANCGYVFRCDDERPGSTEVPSVRCPSCGDKLVCWCPQCWAPLKEMPTKKPICSWCGGDVLALAEEGLFHPAPRRALPRSVAPSSRNVASALKNPLRSQGRSVECPPSRSRSA